IDIYTELGELVDTLEHTDGSGDEFWDHTTTSRQTIVSGIYIAVITVTQDIPDPNSESGGLLYRNGEQAIKKFVIIR
ncbi:MAG: fibronectin, partial [Bacteroidota bacterium]